MFLKTENVLSILNLVMTMEDSHVCKGKTLIWQDLFIGEHRIGRLPREKKIEHASYQLR